MIDINTDISNILNVAEHYGQEMPASTRAAVALLARAMHISLRSIIRDTNRALNKLEAKIDEASSH